MDVSRYVVEYLRDIGVKHVFGIIGSAMYRVFKALGEVDGIDYICPLHEQAVSMGADGYSRSGETLGVAIASCGPGTTNLLTGCAGAYTDSVPVLYLVGYPNIKSSRQNMPIRHLTFQEFDIVNIFQPVTKYVKMVEEPEKIKYELQKSISIAMKGRKGPVMLILPENVMFADVDTEELLEYKYKAEMESTQNISKIVSDCFEAIKNAKKPIIVFGGGVRGSGAVEEAKELSKIVECPIAMTYPMLDMLDDRNPLKVTSVGVFGTRAGNFAIQSADMLLCVGTRMEGYFTGNTAEFAHNAKKIVIDIDQKELDKLPEIGIDIDQRICMDAKRFLTALVDRCRSDKNQIPSFKEWVYKVNKWKEKYPIVQPDYYHEKQTNPYVFFKELSDQLNDRDRIIVGCGMASVWMGQAFHFKEGQRWIMQFSTLAMGYGLPAALGASFATNDRVICVTGDGSLQMSIQELASIVYYKKI